MVVVMRAAVVVVVVVGMRTGVVRVEDNNVLGGCGSWEGGGVVVRLGRGRATPAVEPVFHVERGWKVRL